MKRFHGFLSLQARGTIALPPELRRRYRLDEPGAQLELTERVDGVLELRPSVAVPVDQAWFWKQEWQAREQEVDDHVRAGRVRVLDAAELLAHLDELDRDSRQA